MVRRIGLAASIATLAGLALAVPSGAVAATTVGQTFDPTSGGACSPLGRTFLQTAPAQYVIPSSGVLTSWSYQAAADPPQLKFKVARLVTGTEYLIVGSSDEESPPSNGLISYGARIPVQAGDVIGMYIATTGECFRPAAPTYEWADYGDSDPSPGQSYPFADEAGGVQFDIAAKLEADADNDGYGDETQDQCPTNAATAGPCPPAAPTGQRAAAKKKCKKKFPGKANAKKRKKCIKKARLLPL